MIPGVVGQQAAPAAGGAAETPDWLPLGAVAHLDFVNGNYWAGGAERAAADILGGDFNPAKIDAAGLLMQLGAEMYGPRPIGALFTDLVDYLQAGCTIAIDLDAQSGGSLTYPEGTLVYYFDNADPDAATHFLEIKPSTSPRSLFMGDDETLVLGGSSPNIFTTTGIQAVAFTLSAQISGPLYRYAVSINAGTGQAQDKSYDASHLSPATIRLFAVQEWDYGLEDCYVRRLTLYPPVTDLGDLADYSVPYFLPIEPDAAFADVVFLSAFDGTDGATSATDDSASAHTITFVNGELDTAQKKFGTASLLCDSTADNAITIADSADWHFGADPFVIEGFIRFGGSGSIVTIRQGGGGSDSWQLDLDPGGAVTFQVSEDGSALETIISAPAGFTTDTWHYFCLERDSNKVARFWKDSTLVAQGLALATLHNSTQPLSILPSGVSFANAWIDELRITKGAFWYGPDHPGPPVSAFPRS